MAEDRRDFLKGLGLLGAMAAIGSYPYVPPTSLNTCNQAAYPNFKSIT